MVRDESVQLFLGMYLNNDDEIASSPGTTTTTASSRRQCLAEHGEFPDGGERRVRLRATDDGGLTRIATLLVEVRAPATNRAPSVGLSLPPVASPARRSR